MEDSRDQRRTRTWLLAGLLLLGLLSQRCAWGASAAQCGTALDGGGTYGGGFTYISPLSFGAIIPSVAGGTVTVDPATGTATAAGVTLLASSTTSAAVFNMSTGTAKCRGQAFTITLPTSATLTSGANSMTITSFTSSPVTGSKYSVNGAPEPLYVGGTLNVGSNQPSGIYTGTFTVTVTIP